MCLTYIPSHPPQMVQKTDRFKDIAEKASKKPDKGEATKDNAERLYGPYFRYFLFIYNIK